MERARLWLGAACWLVISILVLQTPIPPLHTAHPSLGDMIRGAKSPPFGAEYLLFREHIGDLEPVGFITDRPYDRYRAGASLQRFYTAQVSLVPLLLDPEPGRELAIVHCTSESVAARRLAETGYVWRTRLGEGKGIARMAP